MCAHVVIYKPGNKTCDLFDIIGSYKMFGISTLPRKTKQTTRKSTILWDGLDNNPFYVFHYKKDIAKISQEPQFQLYPLVEKKC